MDPWPKEGATVDFTSSLTIVYMAAEVEWSISCVTGWCTTEACRYGVPKPLYMYLLKCSSLSDLKLDPIYNYTALSTGVLIYGIYGCPLSTCFTLHLEFDVSL